jgi:hypothetical protein
MGIVRRAIGALAAGATLLAAGWAAAADLPTAKPAPAPAPVAIPGWTFTVTPYLWLPTVNAKVNLPTPGGSTVSQSASLTPGDYLPDLRFGFMGAAEAKYDRFVLLTDLFYSNIGLSGSIAKFGSVSGPAGAVSVPASAQLTVGGNTLMTIWNAAAGYELASGAWGDVKGIAGFRLLNLQDYTYYALSVDIGGPRGGIALGKNGALSLNQTYVDGIVGVTGRLNVPNTAFYVPYYLDVGTGGNQFTWQGFAGLGYKWQYADLSVGYRYESFQNGSGKPLQSLNLGGPIAAASFHF